METGEVNFVCYRQEMTEYIKIKAPERYHSELIPQFRTVASYLLKNILTSV